MRAAGGAEERVPRGHSEPEAVEAALAPVDAALERGDARRALKAAERALARHPEAGSLHHARGVALRLLGERDAALDAFATAWELAPDLADAYLDAAELLIDEIGDDVEALEVLKTARAFVHGDAALADVALLRGIALAHLADFTGALRALDDAARLAPGSANVAAERAWVLIELLRLEDAEATLRAAVERPDAPGRAHQLLAFLLDYTGRRAEAEAHFRKAATLDPHLPAAPPRLTEAEFDTAVEAAVRDLPARVREHLKNVEIGVENYPDRELCRRHDCSPTTLGLFVGTPLTLRQEGQVELPDRVILFQRSLENSCSKRAELVREIAVTLEHEVGHYLGFSEEDLVERGYE
jgi:predicted Zn-dependent protease with MMP-like domain/Flp pilus assembly protein TadD